MLTSVNVEHLPKLCGVLLNGKICVFIFCHLFTSVLTRKLFYTVGYNPKHFFFLFCSISLNFASWEIFQLALGLLDILPLCVCVCVCERERERERALSYFLTQLSALGSFAFLTPVL